MCQDILHLSNQEGLFHSVIPQLLLLPSPIGSSDINEIQEESTAGDVDLGIFYTALNRVHGLRIFCNENGKLFISQYFYFFRAHFFQGWEKREAFQSNVALCQQQRCVSESLDDLL